MIAILDTGPWVALIDRSETRHAEFDKKDFAIYRLPKKKSFTIIP